MLGCNSNDTPINLNLKLDDHLNGKLPKTSKLIYLYHTLPDIAYVVSLVSQFMHVPRESHLKVVLRIFRYLNSTPGKELFFMRNNHLHAETYTNSDYASYVIDRRSTSGYYTFVGGNLITWHILKL